MKVRNKGKVYPSPAPSLPFTDAFSVLNLLPPPILALLTLLSLQDTQVLAYMITRSLKSVDDEKEKKKKKKKKKKKSAATSSGVHNPPLFDCECFDCYITYWFRWDSSPNRELIHQAIEAFEEHLNSSPTKLTTRTKRKDKIGRRDSETLPQLSPQQPITETTVLPEEASPLQNQQDDIETGEVPFVAPANNDRGLARKVLPDVLGLFNSRLWNLLSPDA